MLHPVFETTFSTITTRLPNNLQTNVVIRITDFCDTNDNEYVSVDLLLNRVVWLYLLFILIMILLIIRMDIGCF